jgi:hypothetical protein
MPVCRPADPQLRSSPRYGADAKSPRSSRLRAVARHYFIWQSANPCLTVGWFVVQIHHDRLQRCVWQDNRHRRLGFPPFRRASQARK